MELKQSMSPYEKMILPIIGPIQCVCACAVQPKMKRPTGKMIMPICQAQASQFGACCRVLLPAQSVKTPNAEMQGFDGCNTA